MTLRDGYLRCGTFGDDDGVRCVGCGWFGPVELAWVCRVSGAIYRYVLVEERVLGTNPFSFGVEHVPGLCPII